MGEDDSSVIEKVMETTKIYSGSNLVKYFNGIVEADSLMTFEDYMKQNEMNFSEVAKQAILEMIFQDDADLTAFNQAMAEYKKNPTTYTHAEVKKWLGLQ